MLLALDQGTTSSRAIVFDDNLLIQASAQKEFQQHYPQSGWVEHDPEEIWNTQYEVACEAIEKAGVPPVQIQSIGITNQRETITLWNRQDGKPLHNAIVWQDRRTSETCRKLREDGHEETIREKTGLALDPYFSASKIRWLLDTWTAREAAEDGKLAAGTIDSADMEFTKGVIRTYYGRDQRLRTQLYNIHTEIGTKNFSPWNIPSSPARNCRSSGTCAETEVWKAIPIRVPPVINNPPSRSLLSNRYATTKGLVALFYSISRKTDSLHLLSTYHSCFVNQRTSGVRSRGVFMGGATIQWFNDGLGTFRPSKVETLL